MYTKYLNFEFWFYQIYLLLKSAYDLLIAGPEAGSSVAVVVFSFIYLVLYLATFLYALYSYSTFPVLIFFLIFGLISYFLIKTFGIFIAFTLVFLCWMFYSLYKTAGLKKKEEEDFMAGFVVAEDPKSEEAEEWQDIIDHIDSDNESQWKLALIDADKILENLLRENGYGGEGVGDGLKTAELQGGIKSLQDAWEAHKIRNRIAHEAGFVLTKREARRAVELYKKVFEELGFL